MGTLLKAAGFIFFLAGALIIMFLVTYGYFVLNEAGNTNLWATGIGLVLLGLINIRAAADYTVLQKQIADYFKNSTS